MATDKQVKNRLYRANRHVMQIYNKLENAAPGEYRKLIIEFYNKVEDIYKDVFSKYDNWDEIIKYNRWQKVATQLQRATVDFSSVTGTSVHTYSAGMFEHGYYNEEFLYSSTFGSSFTATEFSKQKIKKALNDVYWFDKTDTAVRNMGAAESAAIKGKLSTALQNGQSLKKATRELRNRVPSTQKRLDRIFRTEAHRAYMYGREQMFTKAEGAAQRLGIPVKKMWVAVLDARTRDAHATMDSKYADKDGLFHLPGGYTTTRPGLSGAPEHDIHCRCHAETVLNKVVPEYRRAAIEYKPLKEMKKTGAPKKKIVPWMTYGDWIKDMHPKRYNKIFK